MTMEIWIYCGEFLDALLTFKWGLEGDQTMPQGDRDRMDLLEDGSANDCRWLSIGTRMAIWI